MCIIGTKLSDNREGRKQFELLAAFFVKSRYQPFFSFDVPADA